MDKNNYASAPALEAAMASPGNIANRMQRIRRLLEQSTVLALATGRSEVLGYVDGDEIPRLLTFQVSEDPAEYVPLFTNIEKLTNVFERHPEWQALGVVEVTGTELLKFLPLPITWAINPWDEFECLLRLNVNLQPG